jgi:PST family polysaccharide transporter
MKIKTKYNLLSADKKQLFSNIYYLAIVQGINYILPLLTLPYLSRILGPSNIGIIAFSGAVIGYFVLITDFGFNLSATRQISIHRKDLNKVNKVFSSVLTIKFILMFFCFLLLVLANFLLKWNNLEIKIFIITFGMVIGRVIDMFWIFQGFEMMKYITYLNLSTRILFTIGVFIFVKSPTDILIVPILTTFGYIFSGLISLVLLYYRFNIRFIWQPLKYLLYQFREGGHLFLSTITSSLYTTSSTIILGFFSSSATVGYFSSADKIIQAVKSIYTPISQAIFPYLSLKLHDNPKNGILIVKKLSFYIGILMFIISLFLFIFSDLIVEILLGKEFQQSVVLLRIMSFLPFIISLGNSLGVQTMINMGNKKLYSIILFIAALIGVSFSILLVPKFKEIGSSITLLISETFVTIALIYFMRKKIFVNE